MERINLIKSNIESYTDSDPDFFLEFTENILESVESVEKDLEEIDETKDATRLGKLIHLIKPTIEILGELDLIDQLNELKENWSYRIYPSITFKLIIKRFSILASDLRSLIGNSKNLAYANSGN